MQIEKTTWKTKVDHQLDRDQFWLWIILLTISLPITIFFKSWLVSIIVSLIIILILINQTKPPSLISYKLTTKSIEINKTNHPLQNFTSIAITGSKIIVLKHQKRFKAPLEIHLPNNLEQQYKVITIITSVLPVE
ncbi:hypothetical protein KA531_01620 [Candidatus Saccharibacteria bacterium]|nr:hypothetical protein [Candidatus Saccharibacteria bacterium]